VRKLLLLTISKERWSEVLDATDHLTRELLIKAFIPKDEVQQYRELLMDSLRGFIHMNALHIGLKVFVNHERNPEFNEWLGQKPPQKGQDPEAWGNDVFKGERFGIILNNLEAYSEELLRVMASNAQGLLELKGMPLNGLALLFFMGNYGFTPFGIHKENTGEEGFLMHFGPGDKTFYTWKKEEYLEMASGQVTHPMERRFLEKAKKYHMEPGDAFFVPSDVFHVAETNDFSFSMVLDYLNPSVNAFKQKLLDRIQIDPGVNDEIMEPLLPGENYSKVQPQISLDSNLEFTYLKHVYTLMSNGGFEKNVKPGIGEGVNFMNSPFAIKQPFKLCYRKIGENTCEVFSRGHSIVVPFSQELASWIDDMNSGSRQTIEHCKERLADYEFSDLLMLLGFLSNCSALDECPVTEQTEGLRTR